MPAKIITLSQKDQDLLRIALNRAIEWADAQANYDLVTIDDLKMTDRIKGLKERIL